MMERLEDDYLHLYLRIWLLVPGTWLPGPGPEHLVVLVVEVLGEVAAEVEVGLGLDVN